MKEIEEYPQLAYLFQRRSIRKYKTDPVPAEWIEIILKAAMAAPSAMNNQPWEFIVIDAPEVLEKIRQIMIFGRQKAPLAIAVCGNKLKARNQLSAADFWIQDCSAATENMLLAASSLGLGAVWLGVHPIKLFTSPVAKTLRLPRHVVPLNILYFGYPEEQKDPHTKYDQQDVHWQQYGLKKENNTDKA